MPSLLRSAVKLLVISAEPMTTLDFSVATADRVVKRNKDKGSKTEDGIELRRDAICVNA
jgi:hypothetical protein